LVDTFISPFRRAGKLLRGQASGAAELDETFWALKDVSFEIKSGEVVGIIGHNGAGKSTLLKILSDITEPSRGYADVYGRVGSLLEVGTGFHPELTGRENIYLNGAILGMKRLEIERKFDEIVAFAEIDKFIDTPVKHYSSGMYVRLAFAVAAHLEPEILLVDEVLAVGDIAFQKKCLGKMDNVSQEGRTVILVSHNMNAIQRLCPRSLLLNKGKLVAYGETPDIIAQYLSSNSHTDGPNRWINLSGVSRSGTGKARFEALHYSSLNQRVQFQPFPNGPLEVLLDISSEQTTEVGGIAVTLYDQYGSKLVNADTRALGETVRLKKGHNTVKLRIEALHLNPGIYTLGLWLADPPSEVHDTIPSALRIEVVDFESKKIRVQGDGLVTCKLQLLEVD
jgi:lipopolysaccharide transport system ATP-binding protein